MQVQLQMLHADIVEIRNAKQHWTSRCSVRVYLRDQHGHIGLGEAAPLLGMSSETATEARQALADFKWPDTPITDEEEIASIVASIDASLPSVRFAVESALLSLGAASRNVPLWAMWDEKVEAIPNTAALMSSSAFDIRRAARIATAHDVGTVKMKYGARSPQADEALVRDVRSIMGPVELRIDANGSIEPDDVLPTMERLAAFNPVFLEEPCPFEALGALGQTPFPVAVDESLAGPDPEAQLERALSIESVGVIVLKPSLLGGLSTCRSLAKQAREAGREVVISHLMEGAIGRCAAAHLALSVGGKAAGLGYHTALEPLSDGLMSSWIDLAEIYPPDSPGLGIELAW